MSKATDPKAVAFLVCDHVIQDVRTGKKSYVGVFDNINANTVPCLHQEFYIAIILTGCRGKQNIILELSFDASSGEKKVMQLEGNLESADPLEMIDLIFEMKNFVFTDFGKYTLRIISGDSREVIAHRPFRITKVGG